MIDSHCAALLSDAACEKLFEPGHSIAEPLLRRFTYPWEALSDLHSFILDLGPKLSSDEFDHPAPDIWIAKDAAVAPSVSITGPCIIDRGASLRHCAFIRGDAVIGKNSVVGNSCEVKNAIISDFCEVPHFNYVGDSVLGFHAHLGAGAVTSNVKSDRLPVRIKASDGFIDTDRKKVGAMLGDWAEVGSNSVLCPGAVVGAHTVIYPLSRVRGVIKAGVIYKDSENITERK